MALSEHDKTIERIVMILGMLHENKRPTLSDLAQEFNVSQRTIQRDIYQRLHNFPIEKTPQGYLQFIDGFRLGYAQLQQHEEFLLLKLALSQFENTQGSFKELSERLLKKMIRTGFHSHYFIKPPEVQALDLSHPNIRLLEEAVERSIVVTFQYKSKSVRAWPYKIVNFDGIWYLFAKDTSDHKTRSFTIAKLKHLAQDSERFARPANIDKTLAGVHTAWFDEGSSFDVEVKIDACIAHFFTLRKQLSSQELLKTYEDGSLHVRFEISHDEDVDNLIKAWIPHIQVLKPTHFRNRITQELKAYVALLEKESLLER